MDSGSWHYYFMWFFTTAFVVALLLVLARSLIGLDRKFNMYIHNVLNRSALNQHTLLSLRDVALTIGSVVRPMYAHVFNKHITDDTSELQQDLSTCVDSSLCTGEECCCLCEHHTKLRVRVDNNTIFDIGYVCSANTYTPHGTTYTMTKHGHCKDFTKRVTQLL